MYFSKMLFSSSKENPKDSVVASHSFLIRGGFVQQVSAGIYNFLPLGLRVLSKVEAIIRQELNSAGAQESKLGFVTPIELWEKSGRANKYGNELLKFKDRKNNSFVLGPTHEEMMVNMVSGKVKSYKQLPVNVYQINTKFRDEARPRFGILRAREFLMKDGYSFHIDEQDMKREFSLMETTYSNIFSKIGLDYRVVDADSGAIGGTGSKEFMILADSGEDDIIICSKCNYSANIEKAVSKNKVYLKSIDGPFAYFLTPNVKTIEEVGSFFRAKKEHILKAVVKVAIFDDSSKLVVFFIRGSKELQEVKALNVCGATELIDATPEDLAKANLEEGFVGPVVLESSSYSDEDGFLDKTAGTLYKIVKPLNVDCFFDKDLEIDSSKFICGANKKDYHFVGFDLNQLRDIKYDDFSSVEEGDKCIECGSKLDIKKGIEVGHIFQLGTKYSEALDATFLDNNGKSQNFFMGTYGIGVSRILSAAIEQNNDERGCIWPKAISPFEVIIIVSDVKKSAILDKAQSLYEELISKGIDVLLDDRSDRFGSKMKDFELIGIPFAIIVGKSVEENGVVEITNRKTLEKQDIDLTNAVSFTVECLSK